ncbi:hypothetical protein [Solimonas sp. SE-A11]|uniref:hypothetical protein n=1 Tax=Solimonas sp. SE-A11 TaxID=3054954 RepID=UPI00259C760C|nr:hypothetical protein [Solimonas sp. SE-A11]MDM4768718.1 hypothetical protein [Solimonas sp. SE-A11]
MKTFVSLFFALLLSWSAAAPAVAAGAATRSPQEVQDVFDRNRAPLQRIFMKYQQRMPLEQVLRLELRFTVAPDGRVSEPAVVSSTYGDRELEGMVQAWLSGLRFEARDVPAVVIDRYPLMYHPAR